MCRTPHVCYRVLKLESLHAGATMADNLLQLREAAGDVKGYFDAAKAVSLEVAPATMLSNCH